MNETLPAGAQRATPVQTPISGVLPPVVTPFNGDLSVDAAAFLEICRRLLEDGAHGLAVFGTAGEANSLSLAERMDLLEALIDGGVDPGRLYPGTGLCALPETVALTRQAVAAGCGGVVMLPPFYYKPVTVEGLYRAYSEAIERVGAGTLRVLLDHTPQISGVALTAPLIRRLIAAYPGIVVGIKDSSGDWANTASLLREFPGFAIFQGSESLMTRAAALGAAGCISATLNVNPGGVRALYDALRSNASDAIELQGHASEIRGLITGYPLLPAVKAVVAARFGRPGIARVRPPLEPLGEAATRELLAALDRAAARP